MASFTINPKGQIVPYSSPGSKSRSDEMGNPPTPATKITPNDPGYPKPDPGGGGSGGGSTAPPPPPPAEGDFSTMLGIYGLPSDVQAKVNQIFANTPDVSQATQLALAFIRGTSWYAQTYPGISAGINAGLINNEADYRAYVNAIDQYTQQYSGRNPTADEIAGYLNAGYNPSYVGKVFQGQATLAANQGNWQYLQGQFGEGQMSASQLTALGNESAGIDTSLGQTLQNHLQTSLARFTKAFNGVVATPNLSLTPQGLQAPGLAGQRQTPDVAA